MPRPRPRVILAVVVLLALLFGIWLWLRDSSLVAIKRVTVTGAQGPDAAEIRSVLTTAARGMTTLDVRVKQLNMAVAPYPVVKSLQVSTQFPHGIRIRVIEEVPVAEVMIGGRGVPVAGDGTLLHDGARTGPLPLITLREPPGGGRLADGTALQEVALLDAAPEELLSRLALAGSVPGHGLAVQLRNGPSIYFGDAGRLSAKWSAAAAVLADSHAAGAAYIDVSDPQRPAAGAGTATSTATGTATPTGAGTATSTTPAATTPTTSPTGG